MIGDAAHPMLTCKFKSCFWVSIYPVPKWPVVRSGSNMSTVQGQGGGQAIEDGAALGILFDQVHEKGAIEERLQLFEQVRRNRGSALQILSNTNPPASQSVRDAAAAYLPAGTRLDSTDDINDYVFSFDVIGECKAVLATA